MPITLEPFQEPPLCSGYQWLLRDEEKLSICVAFLVAGYYQHVARILSPAETPPTPNLGSSAIDAAIAKIQDSNHWHRDGWLFQMISWIAAQLATGGKTPTSAPQPRPADKGLDGLIIELSSDSASASAVVICEDKATNNPRQTIRSEVWPELDEFETGRRDNELVSEVTSVLRTYALAQAKVQRIIEQIYWQDQRHYRVSITVDQCHDDHGGRQRLFAGYDVHVAGDLVRRRAETVHIPELRAWLERFAHKVIARLSDLREP